ncbi:MAG: alkene reductase [Polyangiaceae bacterium]|nr:alkene reductase [Polyangiaceae bacterium]
MKLLSPFRLGRFELQNRAVMAPMTRSRAIGGLPNDLMRDYYAQRASAGLIITEGTAPSPNALGYARIPGLFDEAQVRGWRSVTDAVHDAGGRIVAQLMHTGRIAHPDNLPAGARVLAPSAVRADGKMYTDEKGPQPLPAPEAMTAADLHEAREEFALAAKNAIDAGFDGVELHGANGYLLEQFLHPHTNRREDEYGGSTEKRARFVVETAQAAAERIGADRVAIRLSPHNGFNDLPAHGEVEEQYSVLARALRGLLYVHIVQNADAAYPKSEAAIREGFGGPLILNGGFDHERAEAAIAAGRTELVSFGRPFIANPDLIDKWKTGADLASPDPSTFYTPGAKGYVDYVKS